MHEPSKNVPLRECEGEYDKHHSFCTDRCTARGRCYIKSFPPPIAEEKKPILHYTYIDGVEKQQYGWEHNMINR